MIYKGSYITSFENKEPLDKKELTKLAIVVAVSSSVFMLAIIFQLLPIGIISGSILALSIWLLFGNYLSSLRKKNFESSYQKEKEIFGEDWLRNPKYQGGSWTIKK